MVNAVERNPLEDACELWTLESADFLHYVVEYAEPVRVIDYDSEILAAFKECHEQEVEVNDKIIDVIVELGGSPGRPPYNLDMGYYNFSRADSLLATLQETIQRDIEYLETLHADYEDCEELDERQVAYLIDELLGLRREFATRVEKLIKGHAAAKAAIAAAAAGEEVVVEEEEEEVVGADGDEFPWHDDALSLEERMELAKGRGLFEQLYAAMAQTDCTACGYDCEGYARAIADGEDTDLTKCAPGELETQEMLESLMKK